MMLFECILYIYVRVQLYYTGSGVNVIGKHFIPFGGAGRPCAGAQYSRALMAAFLQFL